MTPRDISKPESGVRQILGANPAMRRAWLRHNTGHVLDAVAETGFAPEETRGNIENLVGATQVPLGIGGPIRVNGQHADGLFYVPFATTEGTLVTTYQYGMRAITEAGGANTYVLADALDITPCFVMARHARPSFSLQWLDGHVPQLRAVAAETTAHGRLVEVRAHVFGRRVFARFVFSTGDAMGMNMVNLAVERICRHVTEAMACERYYLRCNYSSDKKPAAINLFRPYGKEVAVDLTLPAERRRDAPRGLDQRPARVRRRRAGSAPCRRGRWGPTRISRTVWRRSTSPAGRT